MQPTFKRKVNLNLFTVKIFFLSLNWWNLHHFDWLELILIFWSLKDLELQIQLAEITILNMLSQFKFSQKLVFSFFAEMGMFSRIAIICSKS